VKDGLERPKQMGNALLRPRYIVQQLTNRASKHDVLAIDFVFEYALFGVSGGKKEKLDRQRPIVKLASEERPVE
jgi:hypothetical protein